MGRRTPRPTAGNTDAVLTRLRRYSRGLWLAALGLLFGGTVLLAPLWGRPAAARWAAQAGALMVWVFVRLETLLDLNRHSADNRLRPSLGVANMLTLVRAALVAVLAGFVFQNPSSQAPSAWLSWAPGVIYLLAALMDAHRRLGCTCDRRRNPAGRNPRHGNRCHGHPGRQPCFS